MSTKQMIYQFILAYHNTFLTFPDKILLILLFCFAVICVSIIYMNVQNCSKRSITGIEYMLYQFCSAYHNSFCIVSYNIILIKFFCFWDRILFMHVVHTCSLHCPNSSMHILHIMSSVCCTLYLWGYSRDCKLALACHFSQWQHNWALSKDVVIKKGGFLISPQQQLYDDEQNCTNTICSILLPYLSLARLICLQQ